MQVQTTYMRNKQKNFAIPKVLPLYPKPQASSTDDTGAREDLEEPQPWLLVIGRAGS
jgi:hypothetical protein